MELLAQKWRRGIAYSGLRRCVYVDEVTGGCVSDVVCERTKMDVLQLMEARWSGETPRSLLVLARGRGEAAPGCSVKQSTEAHPLRFKEYMNR